MTIIKSGDDLDLFKLALNMVRDGRELREALIEDFRKTMADLHLFDEKKGPITGWDWNNRGRPHGGSEELRSRMIDSEKLTNLLENVHEISDLTPEKATEIYEALGPNPCPTCGRR